MRNACRSAPQVNRRIDSRKSIDDLTKEGKSPWALGGKSAMPMRTLRDRLTVSPPLKFERMTYERMPASALFSWYTIYEGLLDCQATIGEERLAGRRRPSPGAAVHEMDKLFTRYCVYSLGKGSMRCNISAAWLWDLRHTRRPPSIRATCRHRRLTMHHGEHRGSQ